MPKKGKSDKDFQKALEDFAKNNPPGTYTDLRIELVVAAEQGSGGQVTGRVTEYRILP